VVSYKQAQSILTIRDGQLTDVCDVDMDPIELTNHIVESNADKLNIR
jgi:hypothetical protein